MASSMRLIASSNPSDASRQLLPKAVLKSARRLSKSVMSMFCFLTCSSSALTAMVSCAALRSRAMIETKNCGRTTNIFEYPSLPAPPCPSGSR